jgi:ABC-2 type transport system permease protein
MKLRSVRVTGWLLLTTAGLVALLVLVTVPSNVSASGAVHLYDRDLLARTLGIAAGGGWVLMIVVGIIAYTAEDRFGTMTATLLVTPDRRQALTAKAVAVAAAGTCWGVATAGWALVFGVGAIGARDGALTWSAEVLGVLAATVGTCGTAGVVGVAVGVLVRNQVVAIVTALVWLLAVEQLFVALLPSIGRWTPGGAAAGFLQLGRSATTRGTLLPWWAGAGVFLTYAVALTALAMIVQTRRDVT